MATATAMTPLSKAFAQLTVNSEAGLQLASCQAILAVKGAGLRELYSEMPIELFRVLRRLKPSFLSPTSNFFQMPEFYYHPRSVRFRRALESIKMDTNTLSGNRQRPVRPLKRKLRERRLTRMKTKDRNEKALAQFSAVSQSAFWPYRDGQNLPIREGSSQWAFRTLHDQTLSPASVGSQSSYSSTASLYNQDLYDEDLPFEEGGSPRWASRTSHVNALAHVSAGTSELQTGVTMLTTCCAPGEAPRSGTMPSGKPQVTMLSPSDAGAQSCILDVSTGDVWHTRTCPKGRQPAMGF